MATKTFNSFAGIDITAVFDSKPIGTLQAISYHITREKAAIYTMGRANPRSFSRGKRMIAGSLVFILFDANPILDHFKESQFLGDTADKDFYEGKGSTLSTSDSVSGSYENRSLMNANYADQIPPFDVVLSAANEYGERASMSICNVELLNESSGFSIDDIVIEQQHTFIATDIKKWKADDSMETAKMKISNG